MKSSVKVFLSPSSLTFAEKPIPVVFSTLLSIILPKPSNAPPQTNKILEIINNDEIGEIKKITSNFGFKVRKIRHS